MAFLATDSERVTSELASLEVLRAVKRLEPGAELVQRAHEVLSAISQIRVDRPVLRAAVDLKPPELRSLDAVHLATALSLPEPVDALVTYDLRLVEAARRADLVVESPS